MAPATSFERINAGLETGLESTQAAVPDWRSPMMASWAMMMATIGRAILLYTKKTDKALEV